VCQFDLLDDGVGDLEYRGFVLTDLYDVGENIEVGPVWLPSPRKTVLRELGLCGVADDSVLGFVPRVPE